MSDTPETDAKIICSSHTSFKGVGGVVVSEFARRLERERDEALAAIYNYKCEVEAWELLAQARHERDEARAERDILRLDAQREAEHHDRMVGELQRLYAKLEEARAIADELAAIAAHCLGSHSFALIDTAIKIADTLKRWEKTK
jgi:hypothetical protein